MEIENKVVLITGASSGIGQATAIEFAKKGSIPIITYNKNPKGAKKTYRECQKHTKTLLVKLDISKEKSIQKSIKSIIKQAKKIDILINNAGIINWGKFETQPASKITEQIDTNLKGTMNMTKHCLPYLKKQKKAIIINIASIAGKYPYAEIAPYCATKFGIRGFTKSLSLELPNNIKIYSVNPGATATKMTGFKGTSPKNVARIILKTAEEKLRKRSGDDIDVPDYL